MKNIIIAILVALVLVFAFLFFTHKKSNVSYEPWPETEPANSTTPKPQTDPIACTPSITVSSPVQGAAYTTGKQVTIKWTSCGVQNVTIGLMSGGKDHGQITQAPIPASQGSYQWTAINPGKSFTGLNTNSYQIGIESGSLVVKSGTFTVTTPAIQNSNTSYSGQGFSFNHDAGVNITSGNIPNGTYVELSSGNKFNSIKFYPYNLPSNFNPSFFNQTTTINGKIFYYGSVQTDSGTETSYMYKKNGKTLVIQNATLIDLGSVEIN